jgi:hypothetical protein
MELLGDCWLLTTEEHGVLKNVIFPSSPRSSMKLRGKFLLY